jgi:type IV pilus assembly protein PilQ
MATVYRELIISGPQDTASIRMPVVRLVWCLGLALMVATSFGCSPPPGVDYEGSNELDFARELARDRRYREASSLLELEIARRGADPVAFRALLMLAELRERQGDHAGAAVALERATSMRADLDDGRRIELAEPRHEVVPDAGSDGRAAAVPGRHPKAPSPPQGDGSGESGSPPLINNAFFDTSLRQVLSDLSFDSGIPILWDPTVQGLVTYEAIDQPLETVLRAILVPLGYTFREQDGAYWVGSADPKGPAFGSLSQTRVKALANIEADQAIKLLSDSFRPYVKATSMGNLVCITAPPMLVSRIEQDLESIDAPRQLVMIEVIMAEVSRTGMQQVGFNWFAQGPSGNGTWQIGTDYSGSEDPGVTGILDQTGIAAIDWTAKLEALVLDGEAEIRASPRITTLNGRPAGISLTRDQYFIIQTGTGVGYQYNTLESVSSGIKLQITPFVSDGGDVTVYVRPEVGDVTGESPTSELPEISWRRAETAIRVRDGETFSIGGLNLEQEKTIRKKVPLLGDIPLLGRLFRHEAKESKKSELVVFLTPHVMAAR